MEALTWDQVLEDFATHQAAANLTPKTVQNREECLRLLAKRTRKGPTKISLEDLEESLARPHVRTGEPLAAGTKMSERSYYQTFFAWMKSTGRRKKDPARH